MLDDLIEKDVLRRAKLCEYIYTHHDPSVKCVCDILGVSYSTLKNDMLKLTDLLHEYVEKFCIEDNRIILTFQKGKYLDLATILRCVYQESIFMRLLCRALNGDTLKPEDIAGRELVSVSKVYQYRQDVRKLIYNEHLEDNEKKYRTMLLDVEAKTNISKEYILARDYDEARRLLKEFTECYTSLEFSEATIDMMRGLLYLAIHRSDKHPINIQKWEFQHLKNDSFYMFFVPKFKQLGMSHYEEEAAFVSMICHLLMQYNDYVILQTKHVTLWNSLISSYPSIYQLYIQVLTMNSQPIIDEVSLQRHLCELLFYSWVDWPLLAHHVLIQKEDPNLQKLFSLLMEWGPTYQHNLQFQRMVVESFIFYYAHSLLTYDNCYTCNIVATSSDRFAFLFNFFYKYLSSSQFKINSTIFYSLDEVPEELFHYPYVIICEQPLYQSNIESENIFPFTLDNMKENLLSMLSKLLNYYDK